jgi:hypothetical protein
MPGDGVLMLPLLLKHAGVEVHCVLSGRFQATGRCMAPNKRATVISQLSPAPENSHEPIGKNTCVAQLDLACN